MSASPFAFLRGAAPLFYRVLRNAPRLARGPEDQGLLCGDLHLENFGVYRPDRPSRSGDRVVFDLNDLDEAFFGHLHLDLLRVLTSVLLAARGWGCTAAAALDLGGELLEGYARVRGSGRPSRVPSPVTALLERVAARKRRALLERHTRIVGHGASVQAGRDAAPAPSRHPRRMRPGLRPLRGPGGEARRASARAVPGARRGLPRGGDREPGRVPGGGPGRGARHARRGLALRHEGDGRIGRCGIRDAAGRARSRAGGSRAEDPAAPSPDDARDPPRARARPPGPPAHAPGGPSRLGDASRGPAQRPRSPSWEG